MKLASSETPPVDLFPILKYVPEKWASWKTLAKRIRTMQHKIYFRMLHQCEQRVNDEAEDAISFIEQCIQNSDSLGMSREFIAQVQICN